MRSQQCLNGEWNFQPIYNGYIPGNTIEMATREDKIRVPSSWRYLLRCMSDESQKFKPYNMFLYPEKWNEAESGIIEKEIKIVKREGERVWLKFNGILQSSKIYINGKLIIESQEGFMPVNIDITEFIGILDGNVNIKVWCGPFKTVDNENGSKRVTPDGTWFAGMARGIWQDVYLEYISEISIADFQIITSVRRSEIKMNIELMNKSNLQTQVYVRASICNVDKVVKEIHSQKVIINSGDIAVLPLNEIWNDVVLWSPDCPHLYTLKLEVVSDGGIIDTVTKKFGFREVWADKHKFYLNGIRINLRSDAWHYQGFVQQTKEYALNWYKLAKATGINFIRLHGMPYPEIYLEAADEVGMMIIGESAIYGSSKSIQADHPEFIANCYKHLEAIMRRDRNHPSIVMWSMQNEMRWVDGRDTYKKHIGKLMAAMGRLDGTRLISCDGDNRLLDRDDMQILSMHYNIDGTVSNWDKSLPLIFGEHGKWHYISPQVSCDFVGQSAYLNFEDAQRNLGISERFFIEYARKEEVTGISPFNMVNYMMKTMPQKDVVLTWDSLETPGVKPKVIVNNSTTINNGLIESDMLYEPNSAYIAFKDGFKPVTIIADDYNDSFYSEVELIRNFIVYNDTISKKNARITYEITDNYGLIVSGEEHFVHIPGEKYEIKVKCITPKVKMKEVIKLEMKLYHNEIEQYALIKEYKIYSSKLKEDFLELGSSKIAYIGSEESLIMLKCIVNKIEVIKEINEKNLAGIHILVIGKNFNGKPSEIQPLLDKFTLKGNIVVILEQKTFTVGDISLSGRKYFKSFINIKNHKIFNDLGQDDLGFWDNLNIFEPSCKFMVNNAFKKPVKGVFKILLECAEGDFGWGGLLWTPLMEFNNGNGKVILCQLELTQNFHTVPQACMLLRNILGYAETYTRHKENKKTAIYSEASSKVNSYFKELGIVTTNINSEDRFTDIDFLIVDPNILDDTNIDKLTNYVENGGVLVLSEVEPQHEQKISTLTGREIKLEKAETYQLCTTDHVLLSGISAYDLFKIENVTYSSNTNENIGNIILCEYEIKVESATVLLENVKNPWKEFFIEGLDPEPIKMSIGTIQERNVFEKKSYAVLLNIGKGKILISQIKLVDDSKFIRFYTRLLGNLGLSIKTDIFTHIKEDRDNGIGIIMAKKFEENQDFNKLVSFYSDAEYKLNNLGEGPYGYFQKHEKKDGFILLQNQGEDIYFLTLFIDSEINRNPLKREDGLLPDSSIVPDMIVYANCSFKMWINGKVCKEYKNTVKEISKVIIEDVLIDKGMNNLFIICYGNKNSDIKINLNFLNKYEDTVDGLKYLLTLD